MKLFTRFYIGEVPVNLGYIIGIGLIFTGGMLAAITNNTLFILLLVIGMIVANLSINLLF